MCAFGTKFPLRPRACLAYLEEGSEVRARTRTSRILVSPSSYAIQICFEDPFVNRRKLKSILLEIEYGKKLRKSTKNERKRLVPKAYDAVERFRNHEGTSPEERTLGTSWSSAKPRKNNLEKTSRSSHSCAKNHILSKKTH